MYVDAFLDRKIDKIRVAERHPNGKRVLKELPPNYSFYYEHAAGSHRSIFGHPLKKFTATSGQKFRAALSNQIDEGTRIFESDINPVFRCLYDNYHNAETPNLHIGFFDIEADFDEKRGFAPATDPFNKITAITLYRNYDNKLLTFVLKPPTYSNEEAEAIVSKFDDTFLFVDEAELLEAFLVAIEDIDVLTSWNGHAYDIPYTVNRVARILDKEATKRFCLWDQFPTEHEYKNKFGRTVSTFTLTGRQHLDYLELYAKHNPKQNLSYALNSVGQLIVGESKVAYEGSLDDLYKKDFPKFIDYNRQDVVLMAKIDAKLKYIELHNQVAHSNSVLFKTTMGSVSLVETAIINEMHEMGLIVPDRKSKDEVDDVDFDEDEDEEESWQKANDDGPVVGAYVANPKVGLHEHIGCVDINSLYPSAIRALNMSPETLIGQVRPIETMKYVGERAAKLTKTKKAEAWEGIFCALEVQHMLDQDDVEVTVDFFDPLNDVTNTKKMTGKKLHDYIFNPDNHCCITANGTIFKTDVEGVIPKLLARWFAERKEIQSKKKELEELASQTEGDKKKDLLEQSKYWDRIQKTVKILLNSLYGTLLNRAYRLHDERLGQSTTLTGRMIDRHMAATINQLVTGKYDYKGDAIYYCDTDSTFFSAYEVLKNHSDYKDFDWSRENIIEMYDLIAEETNTTFSEFMQKTFNTSPERGSIIRAGREYVASSGLLVKKKKYAVLMYDLEHIRYDIDNKPGELKIMGLDLKRSDTPKYMQEFLEKLLLDLLTGKDQKLLYEDVRTFRRLFKDRPGWEKGSPKKVAELTKYEDLLSKTVASVGDKKSTIKEAKFTVPGHVRASINWNKLREIHNDRYVSDISDSTRIIVCKLLPNTMNMTSVAYPIDEPHLPQWFKELPFDHSAMEETIIDNKIGNLVGVLNWDMNSTKEKAADDLFTWG